jgi:hypothetical protein
MKETEHQTQAKARGFWSSVFAWWCAPNWSRSDPRALLVQCIVAVALMIFGGRQGLTVGCLLLWYLSAVVVPSIWGERLCRRFGSAWGTIIAFAPLWLPLLLALSVGLLIH